MNVHPAKAEVRFRDASKMRGILVGTLRRGLEGDSHRSSTRIADQALASFRFENLASDMPSHSENLHLSNAPHMSNGLQGRYDRVAPTRRFQFGESHNHSFPPPISDASVVDAPCEVSFTCETVLETGKCSENDNKIKYPNPPSPRWNSMRSRCWPHSQPSGTVDHWRGLTAH